MILCVDNGAETQLEITFIVIVAGHRCALGDIAFLSGAGMKHQFNFAAVADSNDFLL